MANFEVMPQVGAVGAKVMRADTADELSEAIGSTGGSGSSGTVVDAYTKSESDGRFAAKSDLDGKLSSITVDGCLIGMGTESAPLQLSVMSPMQVNAMNMLTVDSATEYQHGVVTLKQITDTVADKLTAAGVGAVTGDTVDDVKTALNALIAALTSK